MLSRIIEIAQSSGLSPGSRGLTTKATVEKGQEKRSTRRDAQLERRPPTLKKVLAVFDASLDGLAALQYGAQKALGGGGELIVLHVFPKCLFPDGNSHWARRDSLDRVADALRLARRKDGNVRSRVVPGDGPPGERIAMCANIEDVDLVVAPKRFGFLMKRMLCLMDVVSADEQPVSGPIAAEFAKPSRRERRTRHRRLVIERRRRDDPGYAPSRRSAKRRNGQERRRKQKIKARG